GNVAGFGVGGDGGGVGRAGLGENVDHGGAVAGEIEEELGVVACAAPHEAFDFGAHATDGEFDGVDGVFVEGAAAAPGDHVFDRAVFGVAREELDVGIAQGRGGLHGHAVFVGKSKDAPGGFEVGRKGF